MKKIVSILFVLILFCIGFCGCSLDDSEGLFTNKQYELSKSDSRFVVVEFTYNYNVVYDSETLVMYTVSTGTYNQGTFTMLVDAEGMPLLYKK